MREIKFRAWDKLNNEWCAIDMAYSDATQGPISKPTVFNGRNQCVIMQFTGLLDRHGIEIYEGDIVNVPYGRFKDEDNDRILDYIPCVITQSRSGWFAKPTLGKKTLYKRQGRRSQMFYEHTELVEVIGNIYEHGHLLENESKE